jgi:hypothetical protein
MGDDGLK